MAQGKLKRTLNAWDLTFLGIGSIIGSGWLYAAQTGAQLAGPNAWISWLIGAAIIITIGMVYAELGAAMPVAGGFVRYPDFTHGSVVGFLIGFTSMLAYSSVVSIEAQAVRGYMEYFWPWLGNNDGSPTLAGFAVQIGLIVLFFFINYWSVNFFAKTNTFITVFKFVVPMLIIIFLLMHLEVDNFTVSGADPGGVKGIFAAVTGAGIVFAFNGFRQPIEFAGEAKNPAKDIPRAIILAVLAGLFVYLLLQFAYIGAMPDELLAQGGWAAISFDSPWAGLAASLGIIWLVNLVLLDAIVSPSATGNIYFSATARSLFAWAKSGTFFRIFQKVDPKTGLPRAALWLTLILSIIWMLPARFQAWEGLVAASTSAKALTFMVGPVSMMSLRYTKPNLNRPFVLKAANILAPLAFIASTLVVYWSGWKVISFLVPILIPSLVLYLLFTKREGFSAARIKTDFKAGVWVLGYYIYMLLVSWIGSYGPTYPDPIIAAPWDTIVCAIGALAFYAWGIKSALSEPRIRVSDDEDIEEENEGK